MVEQPGVPEEGALIGPTGTVVGEFFPNEILIQASGEGRGAEGNVRVPSLNQAPMGTPKPFFFR